MIRKGNSESHLMVEIGGMIIMVMVAVLLYVILTGTISEVKSAICNNTEGMRASVKFLETVFGFC